MVSILDQFDIIEETETSITYMDGETMVIEDLSDNLLTLEETPVEYDNLADPENPKLEAFRSLLFDTVYHQLDIREWVL